MMKQADQLHLIDGLTLQLQNTVGTLINNIIENWLIGIRETNPAILDMFKDTNRKPFRHLLPWSGEFAGKYLTCATELYQMTRHQRLGEYLAQFVEELLSSQQADGYLGPWPEGHHLTGMTPQMGYCFDKNFAPEAIQNWDGWAHYHIMIALMKWYSLTGDDRALNAVKRIADLFCMVYFNPETGNRRLFEMGSQDMNYAPIHAFVLLYQLTGKEQYLLFAREIEKDFEIPPAGDYIRCALGGLEFYQTPKPRWESLHSIQAIAGLYGATGEDKYKQAFESIWWSIAKTDVHNTGGFSTREQAIGNPYENDPIETCCTIAYMAMTVDMLKLSGDSVTADALELSLYNASMGSFSPTGRWSTYNTPMEGYKRANYHEIGFQCRPGSPDLNCCSVNAPRAFGLLSQWACMRDGDDVTINYYGSGSMCIPLADGQVLRIEQKTDYPYDGRIIFTVNGIQGKRMALKFRIPYWSELNSISVNGIELAQPVATAYYAVEREWQDGDIVELTLDFSLHFWAGEQDYEGKCSIYRGPVLLAFDPYYDSGNLLESLPVLDAASLVVRKLEATKAGCLFFCKTAEGSAITLCDLYSAGVSGTPYTTWFSVAGVHKAAFSRKNLTRSSRPEVI